MKRRQCFKKRFDRSKRALIVEGFARTYRWPETSPNTRKGKRKRTPSGTEPLARRGWEISFASVVTLFVRNFFFVFNGDAFEPTDWRAGLRSVLVSEHRPSCFISDDVLHLVPWDPLPSLLYNRNHFQCPSSKLPPWRVRTCTQPLVFKSSFWEPLKD